MRVLLELGARLTGLLHPDWDLRVGAPGTVPVRRTGVDGVELEGLILDDLPPVVARLVRCDLPGAGVRDVHVGRVEGCRAPRSTWVACRVGRVAVSDLEDARWEDVVVEEVVASRLRGLTMNGGRLGELVLVDLGGARLDGVTLGRAVAADLSESILKKCDLRGADLRGAVLRRVRFEGTDPTVARVEGADFRGARGLDRATRRSLLAAGALFRSPGWYRLLRRLLPAVDPLGLERVSVAVGGGLTGVGVLLCLATLWAVVHPPPAPPVPPSPEARVREATPIEIQRTQHNLARIREALARAHEDIVSRGGRASDWPSMEDFQQARYDLDGSGPGEERAALVQGGLPDNLLTDAVGSVLPYCNEVATQETLSGVEADWHYCEETGRIFASAGYSGLPTVQW